ncbi:MAG: hypothetical protein IPI67_40990 [Myxococcales bacterium]|nr:hypothetical protein [Myxococcales bacterium]
MISVFLVVVVAGLCVRLSVRRWASVARVEREAILSDGLERANRERLLAKLSEDSALGRTAREVLACPSRPAAVATLNETLGEIARELDVSREVPQSAARVSLAWGMLVALVELARRLPDEGAAAAGTALPAAAVGIAGSIVCTLIGRSAAEKARRSRDGWDRLGRILERQLTESDNVGERSGSQRVDPSPTAD